MRTWTKMLKNLRIPILFCILGFLQKLSSRRVPSKRCSENIQAIYRRTPLQKCDFNKVVLQLYWNRTSAWVLSCKFAVYFKSTFPKSTPGRLLLHLKLKLLSWRRLKEQLKSQSFIGVLLKKLFQKKVLIMAISTNRPGHQATDISGWGPNEFYIKSVKKWKYISLRKSIIK